MQQEFFEEDNIQQKLEAEEQEADTNQEIAKEDSEKKKRMMMPKVFNSAKKRLIGLVEGYLKQLRLEYISRKEMVDCGKLKFIQICFNTGCFSELRRTLQSCLNLQYSQASPQLTISMPDIKSPIFLFIPERQMIASYSLSAGLQKKEYQVKQSVQIPDIATPIEHSNSIYLLDGSIFNVQRRVFIPVKRGVKIDLQSGTVQPLKAGRFNRMKCGVIKHQQYVYLLGGFVTDKKIKTSTCERFNLNTNEWENIPSLSQPHTCATACVFNEFIFLFSRSGIERFNPKLCEWMAMKIPCGMCVPSFGFIQQISKQEIAFIGGWEEASRLQCVQIYNVEGEYCSNLGNILPLAICRERVSGISIVGNKMMTVSPFYGEVHPQLGVKKGIYQVTVSWGCFSQLREFITI